MSIFIPISQSLDVTMGLITSKVKRASEFFQVDFRAVEARQQLRTVTRLEVTVCCRHGPVGSESDRTWQRDTCTSSMADPGRDRPRSKATRIWAAIIGPAGEQGWARAGPGRRRAFFSKHFDHLLEWQAIRLDLWCKNLEISTKFGYIHRV